MPSQRKLKSIVCTHLAAKRPRLVEQNIALWSQMPAVGREFGSPDFERLMAEDHRDQAGVFHPDLKKGFF